MATTINIGGEGCQQTPPPVTPGTFYLRVWYSGPPDAGHQSGPFGSREAAERGMTALLHRESVIRVELTKED